MTLTRAIPIHVHGAVEVLAAPLLLVAPFALGFSAAVGALSLALGVLLIGLALSIYGGQADRPPLPLTAHAGFDYALAGATVAIGLAVGLIARDLTAAIFLVGFGSAHMALTASTRYTRPLGA
ncbi:MAG TPA: hypothetical protein VHH72_10510 [Solirubrobacterales bacterium]|jgi:hypothetical protein|nr:hypothetical protein [Solirubrobacterales bacterium]